MLSIQESDDWPRLADVAPRTSKEIALPPRLFKREPWRTAVPAKYLGSTTTLIGCGTVNGRCRLQVTDPGNERLAPSALRVRRIELPPDAVLDRLELHGRILTVLLA